MMKFGVNSETLNFKLRSNIYYLAVFLSSSSPAEDRIDIPITVKAEIMAPPCTLNRGETLNIDFEKQVQLQDVNLKLRPEVRTLTKKIDITCPLYVSCLKN